MEPRHMKLKTQKVKWKGLLLATALLLIGSGVVQAQVKVHGNIYGGGEKANVVGNDTVRIHGVHNDTILGNVYGGGMEGQVSVNAIVEMSSGVVGTPGQPTGTMNNGVAFCPVAKGGRVFGGGKGSTTDHEHGLVEGNTFVTISGTAKVLMNVYGGGEMASVGSGDLNDKSSGVATVTIEGGEVGPLDGSAHNAYVFGGGKGSNDSNDAYWNFANVDSSSVVMTAGTVWGSLFGGSEDGHVIGDATVNYSGGTLGTNGKTSWDGNIFGGGRNFEAGNNTSGRVGGNVHVFVRGTAAVKGNVFGGGRLASVGIKRTSAENPAIVMQDGDDHGNIYVNILGGTIGLANLDTITSGTVVGGCMGDTIHTPGNINQSVLAHAKNTYVNILGGHVLANVYGGSAYGTVDEDAHVEIKGGEIGVYTVDGVTGDTTRTGGNVFGSGRGYAPETATNSGGFAYYANYGVVLNNTYVYVHDSIKEGSPISSPSIHGIVYGGGEVASVGTYNNATLEAGGTTHVKVTGGKIGPLDGTGLNAYVFGGSQGISDDSEEKYKYHATVGSTDIEIGENAMIDASVLGGGAEGHVWNDVNILIKGGTIGVDGVSLGAGHVYGGGGNMSESNQSAGRVGGNTHITMTAGTIKGGIYGGGYDGLVGVNGNGEMYTTDLSNHGNTLIEISGGSRIGFGDGAGAGNVFGGGKGSEDNYLFGNTANTDVRISGNAAIKGNVYGGGEMASVGHYTSSTLVEGTGVAKVTVSGGTVGVESSDLAGNVYGGGLGKPSDDTHDYTSFGNVDSTMVAVNGGYIVNSVFGGAKIGHVKGNTSVAVSDGVIGRRLTFRERYADDRSIHDEVNNGDVYGGGEGSNTTEGWFELLGRVYGNTNVSITGGTVRHNVYGGGRMASVGTFTFKAGTDTIASWTEGTGTATVTIGGNALIGPKKADLTEDISDAELLAAAEVLTPGTSTPLTTDQYINAAFKYLGGNEGSVYGAGRGVAQPSFNRAAYVKETSVSVEGNAEVVSCVFGGSENGRVYKDTEVTIGTSEGANTFVIGGLPLHGTSYALSAATGEYHDDDITLTLAIEDSETAEDELGVGRRILRGQVFGGGRGTDTYTNPPVPVPFYNPNGGRVYGNSLVTVNGGTIYHNVYGGGTISSVGTFTYQPLPSHNDSVVGYVSGTARAEVVVNGGQIGTDGCNNGNVYGGGLGSAVPPGTQLTYLSYVGESHVTVNGGQIKSNVYGGAANGHVQGDAHVEINETDATNHPTVIGIAGHGGWHSNVFGGGGGANRYDISGGKKHLSISSGRVFGDTYVTIRGGHILHNVYGGGAVASVGTYNLSGSGDPYLGHGKSTVTVTGGTIGYDGNENGMVFGSCRGQIDSIGAFLDSLSFTAYTVVHIGELGKAGPTIKGSVYGGGENGHVYLKSLVNVNSGTIGIAANDYDPDSPDPYFAYRGNVYGGGCGTDKFDTDGDGVGDTYNPMSGIVYGDAEVNINGGYISRNVYGAGAMASVGYYLATEPAERHDGDTLSWPVVLDFSMGGKTEVNIYGGHIGTAALADVALASGNVFGATRGDVGERYKMAKLANVKEAYVTVNFDTPDNNTFDNNTANVIIGSVFGGGESGHVYDTASVTVNGGLIVGSVFGAGDGSATYKDLLWDPNTDQPASDSTMVRDIIAGKVFGNTSVTVNNGKILRNVYGGGNMASVGKGNYVLYGEDGPNGTNTDVTNTLISGRAHVKINGGTIGTDDTDNGHVFGSSRGVVHASIRKEKRYLYNRDYFLGYVNQAFVTIGENAVATPNGNSPRIYGSVFGSGQDGHVRLNTEVVVNDAEIGVQYSGDGSDIASANWKYRGNVYGAGRGIEMYDSDGDDVPDSYCSSAGSVTRNTHVIVNGGLIHRDVYGGGSLGTVGPPPTYPLYLENDPSLTTVDILGGTIGDDAGIAKMYGGNVYGSSRGEATPVLDNFATVKEAVVNIGAKSGGVLSGNALVNASVYGSGENGHVNTNATVNIYAGRIGNTDNADAQANEYCGNVFGAGSGTDMYDSNDDNTPDSYNPLAGIVKGNTIINLEGGWVMRSVYGGGEIASVGTINTITKHPEHTEGSLTDTTFNLSWPYEMVYAPNTGKTTINVTGGRVGITGKDSDKDNGDIYGGSKGLAADRYTENLLANVDTTVIIISYPSNNTARPENYKTNTALECITGAVYGGGENGHVNNDTRITIDNGLVGHAIYGGGKGKGLYKATLYHYDPTTFEPTTSYDTTIYSITAGKVFGNTHVTVNGGYVVRNVFGGGNLASVGKGNYAGGVNDYSITGYGECVKDAALWTYAKNSGHAYVTINGGTLGMLNPSDPDKVFKDDVPYGSVFGGCRGTAVPNVPRQLTPRYKYCPEDFLGYVNYTYVTIGTDGGNNDDLHIYGSVYGGAQDGHVRWNANTVVNSGEIGVDYNAATAADTMGTADLDSKHWKDRGNVYGAGSGIGQWEDAEGVKHYCNIAGSVTQFDTVTINGGIIHRNVYGGGNLATVGPPRIRQNHDCPIDSTCVVVNINSPVGENTSTGYGGFVYGASRGMPNPDSNSTQKFKDFAYSSYTKVNINEGAHIFNAVYGGGENGGVGVANEHAELIHHTVVNINGGQVDHTVYGGSEGIFGETGYQNDTISGLIMGNSEVNLLAGTVNNVFGGGRNSINLGGAIVNVGKSDLSNSGITINGNVYGANDHNGTPLGDVMVHIYKTAHTAQNTCPGNVTTVEELHELTCTDANFAIQEVFGGGNEANYTPGANLRETAPHSTTVHVHNCDNTIRDLYGGANAAHIGTDDHHADANVIVEGGRIHRVFGGGKGNNADNISADINGTANTNIQGGLIDLVFGGGNQKGSVLYTNLVVNDITGCDMLVDSIFGGSNEAPVIGNLNTTIACSDGNYENIYGGAKNADITGNVTLNILGSTIENAFGGSKGSEGIPANINGNVTLNIFGGTITNAFGGNDLNGNITGVVTVNVIDTLTGCALDLTNVYGGSKITAITASDNKTISPVVNIINGTVKGDVFGGSLGDTATVTSNPEVNIGYNPTTMASLLPASIVTPRDTVKGNVYGGGSLASTIGNTTVNINQGVVGNISYSKTSGSADYDTIIHAPNSGMVFGGGKGRDTNIATDHVIAMVTGDTRVNIKGGKVLYSVYGGGELSSVSDSAIVTVTGGQVGPAPKVEPGYNIPIGLNGTDGYVFGGGKGVGNDTITNENPYGAYYRYANVNNTLVTIAMDDPVTHEDSITNRLWGSVFGGAEDGHVLGNANVRYEGGLMGTMGTTSYDGNIFGGGRNYSKMNYTAGRVGGDIQVEVSGGQLFGSIFGGGRLALTGVNEKGEQDPGEGHGNVKVVVKGGKIGNENLMETFTKYPMGNIYGGGKGDMKGLNGHPSASALLISLTRNTEVIIKDSIDGSTLVSRPVVYGSVYGGGEKANVGYFNWDTIINPNTGKIDIANINFIPGGGHTRVVVSGGQIGADRMKMRCELADGSYNLRYNDDVGHVYGGGAGIVDNPANYDIINPKAEVASLPSPSTLVPAGPDDVHNYKPLIDLMALVVNTEVIISDSAWVKGSVYGGGGNGHVMDGTLVKIQGGQIGSGDMTVERKYTEDEFATADSLTECPHWPYGTEGNYYPYDPLYVKEGKLPSDGKSWFGNVFGGGSGFYPYIDRNASDTADSTVWNPESGKVYGKAQVEITGGHILTNVYGGCETTDVMDSAVVVMRGGTLGVPRRLGQINRHPVTCYLFGAGKGDPRTNFNTWTNVENVRVEVSGGWIYGSVFGGGEEGHVLENIKLTIKGTTGTNAQAIAGEATKIGTFGSSYVDGNVFGAGRGFSGEALTAGTVGGNVNVNIEGGEMLGSIYGGGRLASVGTYFTDPASLLYGQLKEDTDSETYGHITVNISGGVIGNDTESTLNHTKGGNVYGGSMGRLELLDGSNNPRWPSLAKVKETKINISGGTIKSNVYGGAELGSVRDSATVIIAGGTILRDVYGGGYGSDNFTSTVNDSMAYPMQIAGRVQGNTLVKLTGGWVKKSVYGGGEMASVGYITNSIIHPETGDNSTFNLSWPWEFVYAEGTGNANVVVNGGRVGITGKDEMGNGKKEDNGDIYGGSKGLVGDRYVMAHCANVNKAVVNIAYPNDNTVTPDNYLSEPISGSVECIAGAVYGGGENGHVNDSTSITLTKGLVGHAVYGGGKGKDTYDDGKYDLTAGKVYGNTHVNIKGGYVVRSVFGGGNLASVGKGNYAGGEGDYNPTGYGEVITDPGDWTVAQNSGHTYVNITGGVLGRLDSDDPNAVFKDNVPYGSVFGGCRGMAVAGEWDNFGFVNYTHVKIGADGSDSGPRLYGSVFGGAQDGHVRWTTNTVVNSGEIGVDYGGSEASSVANGSTDVTSMYWATRGNVAGGGSGIGLYDSNGDGEGDSYSHIAGSVLKSANVTINGGTIHRNVYGGGNLASVGPPRYGEHDCDSSRSLVTVNINSEIGRNTESGYGGYVFGGSKGRSNPDGEGFPFRDFAYTSHTRVNLNNGARVCHDVFGGGENGQVGTPHVGDTLHTSVINIYDGAEIGGSVFGGGQGVWGSAGYLYDTISGRVMGSTRVNLNNSQVVGNIYGGGALGVVMDSAVVVIAGGQVHDVFGASKGYDTKDRKGNADVTTATRVNIDGGTVHGSVYGGGEFGSVGFLASEDATVTTNVNLNAGHLEQSAYGGGKNGFSRGGTFMNVSGTCVVDENVFGGAYGRIDTVFVAGLRTVNMRGGTVKGSVYGGSYNANDALVFTPRPFDENDTIEPACLVNYSGGQTNQNVFGAGYFGKTFGSTYVFVGERAITSAPNHSAMVAPYNEAFFHDHKDLVIKRDIWSGADFGTVEPGSGSTFGGPTITGRSDIYIDGFGYDTRNLVSQDDNSFMDIGENVFGCGTLNDGGRTGKIIMMRNYGYDVATGESDPEPWATATRDMNSIQQADSLIIESSHIKLAGRGIVTVVSTTSEPYTIFDIKKNVRVVNGSSLYIDKPIENIGNLYSVVGSDLYDNPTYVAVDYNDLVPNKSEQDERYDNKFRINQGTHVSVNMLHDDGKSTYFTYGALTGFFHMMTDGDFNAFAYARPKDSKVPGNHVYSEHDNPNDGGFVSYRGSEFNIYSSDGDTVGDGPFVQMPYENHTPAQSRNGESYFRVWRYFQSALSILDVQLIAIAQNIDGYTAYKPSRQVTLPPGNTGDYYKLKQNMGVASINYGSEIKTVNAGVKDAKGATAGSTWLYSDGTNFNYVSSSDSHLTSGKNFMQLHPNNAFGLTMIPTGGFVTALNPIGDTVLICTEANTPLIKSKWDIVGVDMPAFDFRLTHNNKITGNFQWDPISIYLEHYNSHNELVGEVEIKVTITTKTLINQDNDVDTYALMVHSQSAQGEGGGDHHDVYSARVLMPTYEPYGSESSKWTVKDVKWFPNTSEGFNANTLVAGDPYDYCHPLDTTTSNFVGMTMYPTSNYDNSNGWVSMTSDTLDLGYLKDGGEHPITDPINLGTVDPRKPFSFQFDLHYDSKQNVGEQGNDTIGRIELTAHFTNYQTEEGSDVKFNVYVHRRGKGRGFYIDGQHGEFVYSGHYPNAAQPSLAGIFYFTDFEPSDTIYIVDKVVANAVDNLSWDGREYNQVNIFRYNGGHPLCKDGSYYTGYNSNNRAYKGVLVDVLSSMSINSIILDGACLKQELKGDPSVKLDTVATNLISEAPMIRVHNAAELSIFGGDETFTSLNNNYNAGSNGGAVDITVGGTLNMGQNAFMNGNYVRDGLSEEHHGGAIHMDEYAVLLLSDSVMINTNNHVNATDTVSENVYISHYNTVIHVGTAAAGDEFGPLNPGSRIGVTKTAWNDMDYMPVVLTENNSHGDNLVTIGNYAPGQIIYDELHQYGLVEYPNREANEDPYCLSKLYFAKTWVNQVTSVPHGYNASEIDTPEELAWAISVVNGYNGQTAAPATNFTLTKDVDMSRYIWVPIGDTANNYRGTFNGDGYMVSGVHSALSFPDKGMFGSTNGATIKNLQAEVEFFRGKAINLGGLVGNMNSGALSNCESAGYLEGAKVTKTMGGLVGKSEDAVTIHSSFALDTLHTLSNATVVGGLVGDNARNLYNSYSNFIVDNEGAADTIGGLVGINRAEGHVENCYSVVEASVPSIAYKNEAVAGNIKECYSNSNNYYSYGTAPQGHGTYSDVLDRKDFGYMYKDNLVTLETGESVNNAHFSADTVYVNKHAFRWPGLLSTLNQWVATNPAGLTDPAPWFRPTTGKINNDLPVLAFKTDSAIAVVDDIAFLRYSKDFDFLLDTTNKLDAQSSMFLYGTAVEVENVPDDEVNVFLNEDAVLMQKAGSTDFNNTTTGVTFDNSCRHATSYSHETEVSTLLEYDWHLLSSPLSNAPLGIYYNDTTQNYWWTFDEGQVVDVLNSYMPNSIDTISDTVVKWDFYSYFEPQYHWINFKRNSNSHAHYDYPHAPIAYDNELNLVPAKGYMMAISENSYLSNTGTLNRDKVSIPVTALAPKDQPGQIASYNKGSNLVGNPYQAYLDLDKVAAHNIRPGNTTAENDTLKYFYIYDADMGVYAPYTPTASTNPEIPSRYLHPHQGFFVLYRPHVADSITMDMEITPSMAGTTKEEGSYLRGVVANKIDYPVVDITARDEKGNRDLAIVELARPELGGVEKVDNLQNSDFKLYTHMGDKNYSLLFTPVGTKKVPLFFKTPEDGNFTLTWNTYNGTCKKMLLIDNITGTEYNMLTGNSYSFTGHVADYAARFYIVFELDNPINIDADDEDFAFFDGTQWVIKGNGQLELIDVTGRVLHSYSMNSRHNHVSFDHVAAGTYLLRLVKDRNNVKTQKIVIY